MQERLAPVERERAWAESAIFLLPGHGASFVISIREDITFLAVQAWYIAVNGRVVSMQLCGVQQAPCMNGTFF